MPDNFLAAARELYGLGLSLIPITPRDKKPYMPYLPVTKREDGTEKHEWEVFMERRATPQQIEEWFGNGLALNIGVIHGEVSNNYVLIDIDHDAGGYDWLRKTHPQLFTGRLVLSGSLNGYHIPLFLGRLPDFGTTGKGRPRGNRTWKLADGTGINIRAAFCQSLAPPSVHPSGHAYQFIQEGKITWLPHLDDLIESLNSLAPPKAEDANVNRRTRRSYFGDDSDIVQVARGAWTTTRIFEYFGKTGKGTRVEGNGDVRLLGNGGLLVQPDDEGWTCHEEQESGGPFQAWAWCRYGNTDATKKYFPEIVAEMIWAAGLDALDYTSNRRILRHLGELKEVGKDDSEEIQWTTRLAPGWLTATA